ncbi:hypothetical protein [Streptomyces sp. NBC_01803]|uniref:hypothetical protein n=1 Tax=Streptomyces sp. NBC_01803 TaxID=2975946 RepID=UPI002DD7A733|nr:hypothetical protein [Streptomyces sp. NBC_01803]WSA44725.1 hypothetical protein OIE51_11235 [Streptomyces sp. NBC_01803]
MTRKQRIMSVCATAAALAAALAGPALVAQPAGTATLADHHPLRADTVAGTAADTSVEEQ